MKIQVLQVRDGPIHSRTRVFLDDGTEIPNVRAVSVAREHPADAIRLTLEIDCWEVIHLTAPPPPVTAPGAEMSAERLVMIQTRLLKMEERWRVRWCEPGHLGCACLGCANGAGGLVCAGVTKEEWQYAITQPLAPYSESVRKDPPCSQPS